MHVGLLLLLWREGSGLAGRACVQEASGKAPQRSFFGRVLAAVGGGPADPRQVLGKLQAEVVGLERLRQALHAGERGPAASCLPLRLLCATRRAPPPATTTPPLCLTCLPRLPLVPHAQT